MNGEPALYGQDLFGDVPRKVQGPLADKFLFPPFSVIRADSGDWMERKRGWLDLGIKSEVGRDAVVFDVRPETSTYMAASKSETSIFDPVLCELAYRWWCPKGGQIVDPFSGGSVRGIIAQKLGYKYWGCDLRQEQIDANTSQARAICTGAPPTWVCGDSAVMMSEAPSADYLFTCPPYGDLEVYSDDPRDLSTMTYANFVEAYRRIIGTSLARLKPNRFACVVVGDFRDNRGMYRGFVVDTINAFRDHGAGLYNHAIFVTPAGTLPVRTSAHFPVSRKLGKAHQDILVFCKGESKLAVEAINAQEAA